MDEKVIKAAEVAIAIALQTEQRVEVVKLKNDIRVNIVKREEVKIPS